MTSPARMLIGALLRPADRELAAELGRRLREHGHELALCASGEELLTGGPFDLVVADAQLPGQWSGLGLIEALRASGVEAPTLLVGEEPAFPLVRQALRLGVSDFLVRPLSGDALLAAALCAMTERGARHGALVRSLPARRASVGDGARGAAAFLVEHGVPPSHRVRIASAIAEVLHLVCDGTPGDGAERRVTLRLQLEQGRIVAEIEAHGRSLAALAKVPPALPGFPALAGELARTRKLCEELDVHPTSAGSRVRLAFELHPLRFDEEPDELGETDFLHPDATRALLSRLARKSGRIALPPALVCTVGRLMDDAGLPARSFSVARER